MSPAVGGQETRWSVEGTVRLLPSPPSLLPTQASRERLPVPAWAAATSCQPEEAFG